MLDAFLIAVCSDFYLASVPDAECCHTSCAKASGEKGFTMCFAVLARMGPRWVTAFQNSSCGE